MLIIQDSAERPLSAYPRPSVAVDTAVLTVPSGGALSVLLVHAPDGWRLPGTFLHEGETLADAVLRSLRDKAGVTGLSPRQLHVFDDPKRDDRGWVLSVAHLDAVPAKSLVVDENLARLVDATLLPPLPYGHEVIVDRAVAALRSEYRENPDPRALIPRPFRLRDLQTVHEAVAGTTLPRDTFRRSMESKVTPTGGTAHGIVGKPARLFEVKGDPR